MRRFITGPGQAGEPCVTLAGEEARHIGRVLRMQPGEQVMLLDGEGREAPYEIVGITAKEVALRACGPLVPSPCEPELRLTLYQALPKADKMEWIIQKGVELGAYAFCPVRTRNCVARIEKGADAQKKQARWQRIALEAAKQSGRARVSQVSLPLDFEEMLPRWQAHEAALVLYENEEQLDIVQALAPVKHVKDIAILIGPEGGLARDEVAKLCQGGARAVGLGPRILRTETAGMAAASVIMALCGEMRAR
ncbi:16S rRNA (uracil(1498)-N(3))-methyltransferase [Luoshenia tenuis]|uniref:16S rRNA (uracil(1498)-N(3))-methyltransferase n=1 Tax=Luoshenia tenuis TaxID=2763654 RepID=UPI003D8BA63F